jgi:hypothetical protein
MMTTCLAPVVTSCGNFLRQIGLPAGGGIVDAGGRTGGVDRVEAHVRAHAGPDIVLTSFGDLAREVRVGQLGAGHPDKVEAAVADREPGGRGIGDARGMEDGDVDGLADATAGFEPGRRGGAHAGDRLGELTVRVDHPDVEVEEVDAVLGVGPEDLGGTRFVHAVFAAFVDGHADAEDEVVRDGGADGIDDAHRELDEIGQFAGELVVAVIEPRGEERVEQVTGVHDLEPVESCGGHTFGGGREVRDDAIHIEVLERLRE